ncbi:hypothetical protein WBG83_17070 [Paenibacillus sp. y28]
MKKAVLAALLLILSIAAGCSPKEALQQDSAAPNINLQISKPDGRDDKSVQLLKEPKVVEAVMNMLQQVPWENTKILMSRLPDYKITTVGTEHPDSYESLTIGVWVSSGQAAIEVLIEGHNKYGKMSKLDSEKLLAILSAAGSRE